MRFLERMDKFYRLCCSCLMTLAFFLGGCNNEKSEIPTFLSLKSPIIEFVPATGSTKQNVEDYWLYVGNDLLGVFSPGQVAPVIGEGMKDLSIHPGIRVNGIRDNAIIYPFLEPFRSSLDLCACAEVIDIQPLFKYKPTAKFSFIEDFESNNSFTEDLDGSNLTSATIQNTNVFEGDYSLMLNVDEVNRDNQITTPLYYTDIPLDSRDVFLEFNYKSNLNFAVGLDAKILGADPVYNFGIYLSPEWKKMYINLTDLIRESNAEDGYRIAFRLVHPGGSFTEKGFLYLDNIKLVHY